MTLARKAAAAHAARRVQRARREREQGTRRIARRITLLTRFHPAWSRGVAARFRDGTDPASRGRGGIA